MDVTLQNFSDAKQEINLYCKILLFKGITFDMRRFFFDADRFEKNNNLHFKEY